MEYKPRWVDNGVSNPEPFKLGIKKVTYICMGIRVDNIFQTKPLEALD